MNTETTLPFHFTEGAIRQITRSLETEKNASHLCLGVKSGGCAGLEYIFSFVEEVPAGYTLVETPSFSVCYDALQLPKIKGMEIDYETGLNNRGFIFRNPNADSTCGCGQSFS